MAVSNNYFLLISSRHSAVMCLATGYALSWAPLHCLPRNVESQQWFAFLIIENFVIVFECWTTCFWFYVRGNSGGDE